jgi:hypothetical protein
MDKQESKKLEALRESFADAVITHWVNDFGVICHIFSIQIESETQLEKIWEPITNRIAIDFQAEFDDEYESWNVYVIFVADFEVSRDLKYKIENDKYSSRKIVMDEIQPSTDEDEIDERILNRIFRFNIVTDEDETRDDTLPDLSRIIDNKLYTYISDIIIEGQTVEGLEERSRVFNKIKKEYSDEI